MKKIQAILIIPILLLVVLIGFNSFYTLDNAQEAIVERFGEMVTVNNRAGLHFKIPFLDNVIRFNTNQIYSLQYGYRPENSPTTNSEGSYIDNEAEEIVLTKNSYLINIGAIVQYRITDPAAFHYNVEDQEDTIRLAFESVLRSNIQNQQLDEALVNKDSISNEILPDLVNKLRDYDMGITITEVKFTDVLLPEEVQYAYDDVNIATNEKDQYSSKAAKYSNEQLPLARAEAYEMVQHAEAYKLSKIAQAKGDVENFNQVFERYAVSKDITKTRLYLETMEAILSKVSNKYIIDTNEDGIIKYLPIGGNQ